MKKYKARKEREQMEAIVRPRIEIEDPSAELLSESRPWQFDDPLQDSFLEQAENQQQPKDYHRVPKLKFRSSQNAPVVSQPLSTSPPEIPERRHHISGQYVPRPESAVLCDLSSITYNANPDLFMEEPEPTPELPSTELPVLPHRHPEHTHSIPIRSRSVPPLDTYQLSMSPPKTNFQLFSQRCAPSPISTSPKANTPIFELSAEEATWSIDSTVESAPAELDGSPVDTAHLAPAPLQPHTQPRPISELNSEPEASPYNRFMTFAKSIHALNANLSPIEETEEEAASRRSSIAQLYELAVNSSIPCLPLSSYSGGTTISSTNTRTPRPVTISNFADPFDTAPLRNTSTRSCESTYSTNSMHSMFSFEYSNSDTEKIYISPITPRRESAAPSLTDVSSLDDFDIDLELDLDLGTKRSRSLSKRDAKLERFFGIRQYSLSDSISASSDTTSQPSSSSDSFPEYTPSSEAPIPIAASFRGHKPSRSSTISISDLDLSLALEHDPHRREIISMHKSLLSKTQNKQDAKLEKFFGCDRDIIQVARKSSTGSRLAGSNDDLKYRTIGW